MTVQLRNGGRRRLVMHSGIVAPDSATPTSAIAHSALSLQYTRVDEGTVNENVFRKVAIERVSSPEQLDLLMQITSPAGWLALATLGALIVAAAVWSIFGSIPDLVDARGLLMRGERLSEIQAPMAGTVQKLSVRPGSTVRQNEVVAIIRRDQAGLEDRRADALSLVRSESLLVAKQRELQTTSEQRATQEELIRQGLAARNSIFEFDRRLNVVQGELNALEREIEILRSRQLTTAEVVATASDASCRC